MAIDTLIDQSEPETIETKPDKPDEYKSENYNWRDGLGVDKIDKRLMGTVLAALIHWRYKENRDLKILVTSKGSSTGLGKTTLAIIICYFADIHGWTAEDKGFVNVNDYMQKYKSCEPYSALLIDEIEHGADNRRAMSNENVDLTHAWAQLRYRNVVSIGTLPSTSMVDPRVLELSDVWINVIEKGKAIGFYVTINDITGELKRYPIKNPYLNEVEVYRWPKLSNRDYRVMQKKKDINVRTGEEKQIYDHEDIEGIKKSTRQEFRDKLIKELYEYDEVNLSQRQIGNLPTFDMTQQQVSQIVNRA